MQWFGKLDGEGVKNMGGCIDWGFRPFSPILGVSVD